MPNVKGLPDDLARVAQERRCGTINDRRHHRRKARLETGGGQSDRARRWLRRRGRAKALQSDWTISKRRKGDRRALELDNLFAGTPLLTPEG